MPVGSVHLWESNYRQGDVGAVSESLKRFGQRKPIVVQASTRTVVAGNHVLKAALALGWRRIAAVVAGMSDADAVAYAVADNRTSDLALNDEQALADALRAIAECGPGALAGTGYDGDDLDALLAKLARDAQVPPEFPAVDADLATAYRCPKCGYEWSGKPK